MKPPNQNLNKSNANHVFDDTAFSDNSAFSDNNAFSENSLNDSATTNNAFANDALAAEAMKQEHASPKPPRKLRRPARSIREIRRRELGDAYQSPLSRLLYALLNGLLYGFGGLLIDLAVVVIRSVLGIGSGDIFWLFTPILFIIGAIMGFIIGKNAGASSVDALTIDDNGNRLGNNRHISMRHDIVRGLIVGIAIFAVIWLIMMIMV